MNEISNKKFGRLIIKSTQLHFTLKKLKDFYESGKEPTYLVIPYVLTCAAFLEAKLNDSLYEIHKKFGEEFALSIMSLSLPAKLKIFVPALTDGKFDINKEHFIYQRLVSLVKVRNSIAHAKPEIEEVCASETELVDFFVGGAVTKFPKKFMQGVDPTLGAAKLFSPLQYHEALDKLDKWFFKRLNNNLSKSAVVISRSKVNKWKNEVKTWVKHLD